MGSARQHRGGLGRPGPPRGMSIRSGSTGFRCVAAVRAGWPASRGRLPGRCGRWRRPPPPKRQRPPPPRAAQLPRQDPPEQAAEADLHAVIGQHRHERGRPTHRAAQAVGEQRGGGGRVRQVAGQPRVADGEQPQRHGEQRERQRHGDHPGGGEGGHGATGQHGHRRARRSRCDHQWSCPSQGARSPTDAQVGRFRSGYVAEGGGRRRDRSGWCGTPDGGDVSTGFPRTPNRTIATSSFWRRAPPDGLQNACRRDFRGDKRRVVACEDIGRASALTSFQPIAVIGYGVLS